MRVMDLKGHSGAVYRFRRVESADDLPAHAGNFLQVAPGGSPDDVQAYGTRRSLIHLGQTWTDLTTDRAEIYVRLNVSRTTRMAEHEDLANALPHARALLEID